MAPFATVTAVGVLPTETTIHYCRQSSNSSATQVTFVATFVSLEWAFSTISDYALPHLLSKAIDVVWI